MKGAFIVTIPFQLASIQHLTPADRIAFQRFGAGPTVRPRAHKIHHAIEAWSTTRPQATAAEHLGTTMTYGELNRSADVLATALVHLGVRPGDRVGLFLTRSIPMVVGILAVLKAGAAYVPQDVRITPERHLRHIVRTAGVKIILTTVDHVPDLPPDLATLIPIDVPIDVPSSVTATTPATPPATDIPVATTPAADIPADIRPAGSPTGSPATADIPIDTTLATATGTPGDPIATATGTPGDPFATSAGITTGGGAGTPVVAATGTGTSGVSIVTGITTGITTPGTAPCSPAQSGGTEGRNHDRNKDSSHDHEVTMPGPSPVHDFKTRNEPGPPQSSGEEGPTRAKGPFARTNPETPSSTLVPADPTDAGKDEEAYPTPTHPPTTSGVAMVIFTSGTTGEPNGVQVTHANLCNVLLTGPGSLGIRPGTRVAQLLNIAFDMAAWEILGTLANGGTLVIRDDDIQQAASQVHVLIATPSVLAEVDPDACPDVHTVAVAGERCPKALAEAWSDRAAFHNSCGPTEVTIVNTMYRCHPGGTPNIGLPLPNTTVYVLDDDLRPCPIGEVGEMWAGGAGVTAGYLGNDKLTAERYRPDPFLGGDHVMFRTRDLGRWTWDGHLEHHGRTDDQVKVRGFRVELDAVTNALEQTPNCVRASTVLHEGRLVGFVSPATVSPDLVREAIVERLPYYCVPTLIVPVNRLPVTDRGKIDRRALLSTLSSTETVA
jgi:amino acid adenylation domain-containing protein